jgi:hypothetical protein
MKKLLTITAGISKNVPNGGYEWEMIEVILSAQLAGC